MAKVPGNPADDQNGPLVVRSSPSQSVKDYGEYREVLRSDFYFSCAYCSKTEAESAGIRFTIDHYEPRSARPDLAKTYTNLMWACDECNIRKGDLVPPESARKDGYRFFRVDEEMHDDHFSEKGLRLEGISKVGEFTIDNIDLNRSSLRKLRELRQRLFDSRDFIVKGIAALKKTPFDRLPPGIKEKVGGAVARTAALADRVSDQIDDELRCIARSPLIDSDPDAAERLRERARKLSKAKQIYPGVWRGRDIEFEDDSGN